MIRFIQGLQSDRSCRISYNRISVVRELRNQWRRIFLYFTNYIRNRKATQLTKKPADFDVPYIRKSILGSRIDMDDGACYIVKINGTSAKSI
jgi:hypothetical protein